MGTASGGLYGVAEKFAVLQHKSGAGNALISVTLNMLDVSENKDRFLKIQKVCSIGGVFR